MSTQSARTNEISVTDYLAGEQDGELRHEYVAGRVYAMTGASARHGLLVGALHALLYPASRRKGCQLFVNDMKVHIQHGGEDAFYYPDLMLACAPDDRADYYREKPCLLIEVLSETSERIDRREKLYAYTGIASLREYLLVAQDSRRLDLYRRVTDDWTHDRYTQGSVRLGCLDLEIALDDIYVDVERA
ncbi:Uma2 family endonuclease [Acidithiobacillus sp. CV18-2]|uniref:Uma2 family endonuclease n=1 Tax=Igneacidithiobacillus copahuensis TaxID=2724909 RepID=A0AAE2YN99_9PROT|nr:Uma2 family endonuclease [Igneacidithiobacillus copahuensis]MBU2754228.1 Uma2 family endonuclease [Acidithiobacillus sp. CV18-3]MBU2755915.1 Uma2 family endonuclease [Acidithiobacillus sp. BN09-2]MBU2778115.1 Uma2 family endonuclease [Acidithiobacillus sp. CV18-2]MBU2796533.1 Uma2 family endonuclease [Acidithiobacillus sp. VAN18-2]MBU2800159.1 Uma2 family endonuclease [Acidithiobacillus sp. VAN18-4]